MRDRSTRDVRCVICNLPVQIEGASSNPPAAAQAAAAPAAAPQQGSSATSAHGSSQQAAAAAPARQPGPAGGSSIVAAAHEQQVLVSLQQALLLKLAQVTECLGAQHPGSSAADISEQLQLAGQLLQALRAAKDAAAGISGAAS